MNRLSFLHACTGTALAFGLLSTGPVSAQLTTGAFEGDAPTGATVILRNPATNHTLATVVATNGRFRFRRLPTGTYEVVIQHPDGRKDAPILVRARLGETVQVN
jgi:hypothetical protein